MDLQQLQQNWDRFAQSDPLWSILTHPDKRKTGWDPDEFWQTGDRQVKELVSYIDSLRIEHARGKALDFGCGIGRLTQPLCLYYQEVHGVDIAPTMIELAREHNRYPTSCHYHLNQTDDLKLFTNNSFDLIYSYITLQHMRPEYAQAYIREFVRILRPRGLLIFQLTKPNPLSWRQKVIPRIPKQLMSFYRSLKYRGKPRMEMYGMEQDEVKKLVKSCEATVWDTTQAKMSDDQWLSYQYCVFK